MLTIKIFIISIKIVTYQRIFDHPLQKRNLMKPLIEKKQSYYKQLFFIAINKFYQKSLEVSKKYGFFGAQSNQQTPQELKDLRAFLKHEQFARNWFQCIRYLSIGNQQLIETKIKQMQKFVYSIGNDELKARFTDLKKVIQMINSMFKENLKIITAQLQIFKITFQPEKMKNFRTLAQLSSYVFGKLQIVSESNSQNDKITAFLNVFWVGLNVYSVILAKKNNKPSKITLTYPQMPNSDLHYQVFQIILWLQKIQSFQDFNLILEGKLSLSVLDKAEDENSSSNDKQIVPSIQRFLSNFKRHIKRTQNMAVTLKKIDKHLPNPKYAQLLDQKERSQLQKIQEEIHQFLGRETDTGIVYNQNQESNSPSTLNDLNDKGQFVSKEQHDKLKTKYQELKNLYDKATYDLNQKEVEIRTKNEQLQSINQTVLEGSLTIQKLINQRKNLQLLARNKWSSGQASTIQVQNYKEDNFTRKVKNVLEQLQSKLEQYVLSQQQRKEKDSIRIKQLDDFQKQMKNKKIISEQEFQLFSQQQSVASQQKTKINQLKSTIELKNKEVSKLNIQIEEKQKQLKSLKEENQLSKTKHENLQKQYLAQKQRFTQDINSKTEELKRNYEYSTQLTNQLKQKEQQHQQIKAELENLASYERERDNLQVQVQTKNKFIENFKAKYNTLDNMFRLKDDQYNQLIEKCKANSRCFSQYFNCSILNIDKVQDTQWLVENLEAQINKKIRSTCLIYKRDDENPTNFHKYIDEKPHIFLLVKMYNDQIIACYSEPPFKSKSNVDYKEGFMFGLKNRRIFSRKVAPTNANNRTPPRPITYDDYFLIWGNSDLRIRSGKDELYSNYATSNASFEEVGNKTPTIRDLFLMDDRETVLQNYEIYQIFFEEKSIFE